MLIVTKYIFQFCLSKSLINVKGLGGKTCENKCCKVGYRVFDEKIFKRNSAQAVSFFLGALYMCKALLVLSNRVC